MLTGERIKITGQINKVGEIVFVSKFIVVVRINGINETFTLADFAAQDRYKFYIFRDKEYKILCNNAVFHFYGIRRFCLIFCGTYMPILQWGYYSNQTNFDYKSLPFFYPRPKTEVFRAILTN